MSRLADSLWTEAVIRGSATLCSVASMDVLLLRLVVRMGLLVVPAALATEEVKNRFSAGTGLPMSTAYSLGGVPKSALL
jgi:hypothetical protein